MSLESKRELAQVVLAHITDIASGRFDLSEAEVLAESDATLGEILAGLLTLNEELVFREQERAAAERLRAEAERRNLELSTPILELGHRVLLLPLVGVVDLGRSEQMIERALEGISTKNARVLVIDVTGIADMDTAVASKIHSTIRAVALLGAQTILTGVSPANARTLVSLEVSLGGALIQRTLGDGLEAAFALTRD